LPKIVKNGCKRGTIPTVRRVKTPLKVISRRERQERELAVPVFGNNPSVETEESPGDLEMTHAEMLTRNPRDVASIPTLIHIAFGKSLVDWFEDQASIGTDTEIAAGVPVGAHGLRCPLN